MAKTQRPVPSISQIPDLLQATPSSGFLRGQLLIEGILIEALRARLEHPSAIQIDEMTYARAVGICRALEMIDEKMFGLLRKIGSVRNKMAHQLGYELDFHEAFELAELAAKSGVGFSDDTIHADKKLSREWYDVDGVVQELFQNLAQDLVYIFDPDLNGPFAEFHSN